MPILTQEYSPLVKNNFREIPGKAAIWSDEDGLSWLTFTDGAEITGEDAAQLLDMAKITHVSGEFFRVLIDLRSKPVITNEARDFASGNAPAEIISAFAVVADDLAMRLVGNFFIRFHKPGRPTQIFNDVNKARAWLLQQRTS